jgi:hypothetical protein
MLLALIVFVLLSVLLLLFVFTQTLLLLNNRVLESVVLLAQGDNFCNTCGMTMEHGHSKPEDKAGAVMTCTDEDDTGAEISSSKSKR